MSAHRVLVTGGAGFIGSHTAKLLSRSDVEPVVYDNLTTGNRSAVRWGPFVKGDILDTERVTKTLTRFAADAVIHFAARMRVVKRDLEIRFRSRDPVRCESRPRFQRLRVLGRFERFRLTVEERSCEFQNFGPNPKLF